MIKFEDIPEKLSRLTKNSFYTSETVRRSRGDLEPTTVYSITIFTDSGEYRTSNSDVSFTDAYNELVAQLSMERLAQ